MRPRAMTPGYIDRMPACSGAVCWRCRRRPAGEVAQAGRAMDAEHAMCARCHSGRGGQADQ